MSASLEKKRKLDTDDEKCEAPQDAQSRPEAEVAQAKTNDQDESYYELSNKKRLTIRKWKGNLMVDLREFYEKNDKQLPGKKGISLTLDQYKTLRDLVKSGAIDNILKEEGGDL